MEILTGACTSQVQSPAPRSSSLPPQAGSNVLVSTRHQKVTSQVLTSVSLCSVFNCCMLASMFCLHKTIRMKSTSSRQGILHLCREVPVAVPQCIHFQSMRFFNAQRFSVLSSECVQHEWCDPQVYSVLDECVDVIRAVLLLRCGGMNDNSVDNEWRANRTRYVSKILLFRYITISSNFIVSSFSSFF